MKIFPLGENALTVEFGDVISRELNEAAISLSNSLTSDPFPGLIECVPAYAATTVFYDPRKLRSALPDFPTAYEAVRSVVESHISTSTSVDSGEIRTVEIPVDFCAEAGLDLDSMSEFHKRSIDEIVEIFLSQTYRVYMLGFLPGFAYMGEVDERIATPRLDSPRTKVPKGSVGIAGRQTGIYPLESPGGWQIIGRTDLEMFDPSKTEPCILSPGDEVRFIRA
jgi:inhibitor of KinA